LLYISNANYYIFYICLAIDDRPLVNVSHQLRCLFQSVCPPTSESCAISLRRQRGNVERENAQVQVYAQGEVWKRSCTCMKKREKGKEVHGEGKEKTRDTRENRQREYHPSAHPVAPSLGTQTQMFSDAPSTGASCVCECNIEFYLVSEYVSIRTYVRAYSRRRGRTLGDASVRFGSTRVNLRAHADQRRRASHAAQRRHDSTTTYVRSATVDVSRGSYYVLSRSPSPSASRAPLLSLAVSLCAGQPAYDVAWYGAISPFAVRVIPDPIDHDPADISCSRRFASRDDRLENDDEKYDSAG